jgi:hypothetical protein
VNYIRAATSLGVDSLEQHFKGFKDAKKAGVELKALWTLKV